MSCFVIRWQFAPCLAVLLAGSLTPFNAVADEPLKSAAVLRGERIHSPMRSTSGRVSLEWTIDASDVIVQAKLGAQRQPQREKIYKQLKDIEVAWPVGDLQRLRAICELYEPGDTILFFLWHHAEKKAWQIFDYIPLISEEIRDERLRASQALLPPDDRSGKRTRYFQQERDAGLKWLAMDKTGKWISDEAAILSRITQRVTTGSRIPPGADRQAILAEKSVLGGFYIYVPQEPEISNDEFPTTLVPPEPEYRSGYLKSVRSQPPHQGKLEALSRIVNYKDAEVIEALKSLLGDNLVNEVIYKLPERTLRGNTYFILKPGEPPLQQRPNEETVRTYIIRRAAWNALQQMGIDVEPPEFTAK